MSSLASLNTRAVRDELRVAVRQLSERGLRCSSKWAAEQLVGLRRDAAADEDQEMVASASVEDPVESEQEQDAVLLAKAYFDVNEFLRAAHTLRGARAPCGRFLRWYSLFLAGEKRKDEESLEESGGSMAAAPVAKPRAVNDQLNILNTELSAEAAAQRLDGYGLYVFALTLRELQRTEEALAALKQAVRLTPCLWAAWCEIASLSAEGDAERQVPPERARCGAVTLGRVPGASP